MTTVPLAHIEEFLAPLGYTSLDDIRCVWIEADTVEVSRFARDGEGKFYVGTDGVVATTNTIHKIAKETTP